MHSSRKKIKSTLESVKFYFHFLQSDADFTEFILVIRFTYTVPEIDALKGMHLDLKFQTVQLLLKYEYS